MINFIRYISPKIDIDLTIFRSQTRKRIRATLMNPEVEFSAT